MRDAAVLSTVLSSPQDAVPESFHTAWYAGTALARKLLIALWRYVTTGELPEGLVLCAA
jgi:hypothetical protein